MPYLIRIEANGQEIGVEVSTRPTIKLRWWRRWLTLSNSNGDSVVVRKKLIENIVVERTI